MYEWIKKYFGLVLRNARGEDDYETRSCRIVHEDRMKTLPLSKIPAIKTPPSQLRKAEPYFLMCCKKIFVSLLVNRYPAW
jgi:hypothetical protein